MTGQVYHTDIDPFVRYAQLIELNTPRFIDAKAYDYRMFYVLSGSGTTEVNGVEYKMSHGSLLMWPPGMEYSLLAKAEGDVSMVGFNFDLTQRHAHLETPIPPLRAANFDSAHIVELLGCADIESINGVVHVDNLMVVETTLLEALFEYRQKRRFYTKRVNSLFASAMWNVVRASLPPAQSNAIGSSVEDVMTYVSEHFSEQITNESIARRFNYHPNYLNRLIRVHTGKSLHRYLLDYRIAHAVDLLQITDMSITDICYASGFRDLAHFSKYFKQKTGKSPLKYRNSQE